MITLAKGLTAKTFTGLSKRSDSEGGTREYKTVRLEHGKTLTLQPLQKPSQGREYYRHIWREGGNWNFIPCAEGECVHCESDNEQESRRNYTMLLNVYSFAENKVKILEEGSKVKDLILYRYDKKPSIFTKRPLDFTKLPTKPISYNVELSEEEPIQTAGLKLHDLDDYIQEELERRTRFLEGNGRENVESLEDEEDYDEDEEEPDESEMQEMEWRDLVQYAREVGVKKQTRKRSELIRYIQTKRGW
jgi:hypothetical protein